MEKLKSKINSNDVKISIEEDKTEQLYNGRGKKDKSKCSMYNA